MSFRLTKWYLDCVTEDGTAFICYSAVLRWGLACLRYGSVLCSGADGGSLQRHTLRPSTSPIVLPGASVRWTCSEIGVQGIWHQDSQPIDCVLFSERGREVRWRCIAPRAHAMVDLDGTRYQGLGYCELLTMNVKPWELPIEELLWGRYLSRATVAVWIQWRGAEPKSWLWINGDEAEGGVIQPQTITLPGCDGVIELERSRAIRSGRLARTSSKALKLAAAFVPWWRWTREDKWVSSVNFARHGEMETGWALHEVVRWA